MHTSELFLTFVRRLIFSFLVILMVATASRAQNAGTVGIATREVGVFSSQSTTASSAILPDFGFGCSFLSYQTSAFTGTIDLEWSPTGKTPFFTLVQAGYPGGLPDTGNHVLQLGGYFPNLRSTATPSAGSISAWYTASAAPCPLFGSGLGTNGPSSPILCDRNSFTTSTGAGGSLLLAPLETGDTVVVCGATLSFNGAPSAGNVQIYYAATIGCTPSSASWYAYTTSSTPQILPVTVQIRPFATSGTPYLCFNNNSGVNVVVSFSYASVHGL